MPIQRVAIVAGLIVSWFVLVLGWSTPRSTHAQGGGVDVWLNVQKGGGAKLNIAVPEFTVVRGDAVGKTLAEVTGRDLSFSGLFSVLSGTAPLPADNPEIVRRAWSDFAAAGAHAGLHGLVTLREGRLEGEMRLYDLTSPEQRLIASKRFDVPAGQPRRLAHRIADEVVFQFTGDQGVADTKIAYVHGRVGAKEIYAVDYDGAAPTAVTDNRSINLSPAWEPLNARSIAFTSYVRGYPDLYRVFVFERRPLQTLSAFNGINTSPAWSPDGKSVALTVSKDGNPEIYIINVATGSARRLTRHPGIDTEPTWSPTGRQIAFTSDRQGQPNIFVMDDEGANVRALTSGGFHTQPRWSPRGDLIAYTARAGNHDIWAVSADGGSQRRLTAGPGSNESASWAPNGRHLAFQSSRLGGWQIFTMQADGSEQQPVTRGSTEATSPSWSSRLP